MVQQAVDVTSPMPRATANRHGPQFATDEELQRFSIIKNLRRELHPYRTDLGSLPPSLRAVGDALSVTHGAENVSVYRVPVGGEDRFLFEIVARPEPLIGIYDRAGNDVTAHRPWTHFSFAGVRTAPSWVDAFRRRADSENLRATLRAQQVSSPDGLPPALRKQWGLRAAGETWFAVPGAAGKGFAVLWDDRGAAHVEVFGDGRSLGRGRRPLSICVFDGTVSLPSPKN